MLKAIRFRYAALRFTYVETWHGFGYVAGLFDAFARRVVGWRASRTAHAGSVLDTLEQALQDRRPVRCGGQVLHTEVSVRAGRYLFQRQGSRSSTLLIL